MIKHDHAPRDYRKPLVSQRTKENIRHTISFGFGMACGIAILVLCGFLDRG